jgi:hypothetical protein
VGRVQVLDDDKGETTRFRHMSEKLFQRLEAAGGGTKAHDGKGMA